MENEQLQAILLFFPLLFPALAQGQPDQWIGIDCGSNQRTAANGIIWDIDDAFIKTGTNHPVPNENKRSLPILNTLRAFTQQNKNCYTLPALPQTRYFVRAIFFYANYDGLNHPPTFDLQIDGNKMVNVASSSDGVDYYEILYWSHKDAISVCLARTQDGEFPFISSLESWKISTTMYTTMTRELAWINTYRYNYGTDAWITGYPFDTQNRIWEPMSVANTLNISGDLNKPLYDMTDESPPKYAILNAIQSPDETSSIQLSFDPVKTITPIYIEAYFTELELDSSGLRWFDIYVNGNLTVPMVMPTYYECSSEKLFGQVSSSNLTIELRPTQNTTFPPVISAIEIYAASDPLITTGTDQDDLDGLATITSNFDQLRGWSGDPCLPTDTVWQWLGCTASNPPRVTSMKLSGYGLDGSIPDFSQMEALQEIDLSNNSLSGQIPGFLGQLPNLTKLNLSYNDLSGGLPSSIRNKRGLTYDISGNPKVNASPGKNKSSKAIIIGLAVGIPLAIILLILLLVLVYLRRQGNQQEQNGQEAGNGAAEESFAMSAAAASTEDLIKPPGPTAPPMEYDADDCLPISTSPMAVKPEHQSMVPEMDLDELEQLIDEHSNRNNDDEDYDCVAVVGGLDALVSSDQSMVPDMDLEELDEIIRHEKERADAIAIAGHKADG